MNELVEYQEKPVVTEPTKQQMAVAIQSMIDIASIDIYSEDKPRTHLGASVIGEDCAAKTWFSFRWARFGSYPGRLLRLFNTGHEEEKRFLTWFRAIGFEVFDFDPSTNKQFRITACGGHFGGSLDAGAIYRGSQYNNEFTRTLASIIGMPVLLEFKTHNRKQFDKLKKHRVKVTHHKHFVQMSTYGAFYGLRFGIYAAYCKDNDELHIEVLELDWQLAGDSVRKATEIITATSVPARISLDPTYFECKAMCSFVDVCHHGAKMETNCRSCRHASAADNAEWYCGYHKGIIPHNIIPTGCQYWAQLDV